MATKKFSTARPFRAFTPVDLGNGKSYIPMCEGGHMEYAMTLDGERIGFATTPEQAVSTLNEVYADRAALLAADLADEAAERDAYVEYCAHCGSTAMASPGNGKVYCLACGKPWKSSDLLILLADAQAEATPLLEARAIRDTDLTALHAAVDSQLLTGCLAALVHSSYGMHLRGTLLDACELCGEPASVTLRIGTERLRLCHDCYVAGWRDNEGNVESWHVEHEGDQIVRAA